jgi:hypothetical protein
MSDSFLAGKTGNNISIIGIAMADMNFLPILAKAVEVNIFGNGTPP